MRKKKCSKICPKNENIAKNFKKSKLNFRFRFSNVFNVFWAKRNRVNQK